MNRRTKGLNTKTNMDIGLSITKPTKLLFATTQSEKLGNNPMNTKQVLSSSDVQMSKFAKQKLITKKWSCVQRTLARCCCGLNSKFFRVCLLPPCFSHEECRV